MSEVIVIPEGEHSKTIGASSAERALNCLGSTLLPGENPQTEYAAEGTAAHTLSQWVREGKPLAGFRGKILRVGEFDFKVGKNMIDSVQTFVDSVNAEGPGVALTEERVDYEELAPGGFGTLDHARLLDWLCRVKDFKHGKGVVVPAKENFQMMLYALGVYFKYRWLFEFDKFVLAICQPRVRHFDEWEISLGHLLQWGYDFVRPRARLALTPGQPLTAGPWCKFCKAKNTCSTRARYKMEHESGTFVRDADEELEAL